MKKEKSFGEIGQILFICSAPDLKEKRVENKKVRCKKKEFGRIFFFMLPGGKHRVACQKAKKTIGKITFCGIGGTASRNLIKPVEY